jgi:hypothetical protein
MSSNFKNFRIETIDGKIQNVSSLCSYINDTDIEEEDLPYLESLRNKLANDDQSLNKYVNEYPLVDSLEEKLLEYYINHYHYDMDNIIDLLEIYNHEFLNMEKIKYNGLVYLINDKDSDIDVIVVKHEKDFIKLVLDNLNTFIASDIDTIFELLASKLFRVEFVESIDPAIVEYANTFNISHTAYYAKDIDGNRLFKIKNGLLVKYKDDISTLLTPSLVTKEENTTKKIINKNKKYKSFDLEDFITLRDKMLNGEITSEVELQRFYYEVRYLINSMNKKDDTLNDELDIYMNNITHIYDTHPEVLTKADKRNVESYLTNKEKIYRKVS